VGDPIVTVTQNRRLQLRAEIPERSYKDIKSIRGANFKTSCDDTLYKLSDLNGRLLSYGKSFDSNTFYLPVIFEFNNVGNLVAGSFAEVYLLAQPKKNVISVPVSALTEEQGVFYVYLQVKSEKEAFIKREVTIGLNNGDRVEITSGLSAGDVVVVKGAYQVKLAASTSAVPEGHSH
nr:efflux transporter periplasmic adaptor subunit [Prevotella sp.]